MHAHTDASKAPAQSAAMPVTMAMLPNAQEKSETG